MFPTDAEKAKSRSVENYFSLYKGDYRGILHYFRTEKERRNHLEVIQNVAGMISRVFADLMFTEEPTISTKDTVSQEAINDFIFRNDFYNKLHESAITQSYAGRAYFETFLRDGLAYVQELNPAHVFVQFDPMRRSEYKKVIISWEPKIDGQYYRFVKIHEIGSITYNLFKISAQSGKEEGVVPLSVLDPSLQPFEITGLDYIPIYGINNLKTSRDDEGVSDYEDLLSLFEELTRVQSQIATQLKKHASAKMAVPLGVLDEHGRMRNEDAEVFEVGSDKEDGFVIPQYITNNNPLIDAAFQQQGRIIEAIARVAEVSTVLIDWNVNGGAERVGALRLRLLRTLSKVKRKLRPYSNALKDMIVDVMELEGSASLSHSDVSVQFGDGLPTDVLESVNVEILRYNAGLQDAESAISNMDPTLSSEQIAEKIGRIKKEKEAAMTGVPSFNFGNGSN